MQKKILTLCIIHQNFKVLLGMKKRGFGVGRWNGFGGKLGQEETIEEAVIRELKEEACLEAQEMTKRGILNFEFEDHSSSLEVHIYSIDKFDGTPEETEEMNPRWFSVDEIPYDSMWPDDIFWLPLLLDGKKFKGTFLFDCPSNKEYSSKIISKELIEVDEISLNI
ncbi:MAG: 8-oxo-dGTP diphosphatase [Candidatus Paceibacterota bacterium]